MAHGHRGGIIGYPEQGDALGALMFAICFGLSLSWALAHGISCRAFFDHDLTGNNRYGSWSLEMGRHSIALLIQ